MREQHRLLQPGAPSERSWRTREAEKASRVARAAPLARGKVLDGARIVEALEALVAPRDRVALEGNNQKQADFLSRALAQVDPARVHDLHMLVSSVSRPEHLALFERGIARRIDFSYAGPQSLRIAQLLEDGKLEIGAIHTYIELYARMFVDLTPHDRAGLRREGRPRAATCTPARTPRTRRPWSRPPPSATGS